MATDVGIGNNHKNKKAFADILTEDDLASLDKAEEEFKHKKTVRL